ncbi:BTB/POZ protein [Rhizophagus clarus]|uniref:BTB/POZ protein n=1 Tax=Rhizophagus clarus TaxID=94130 RepID=A0A8H3QSA0_9GLOM|nr:BTB/POZ protein [Rhizophagus clarus]
MIILCYRSPFLRRTLASNKKNNDGSLVHIKFPNISPEIFQIILKYIYGGIISLNEQEPSMVLEILVAADQLYLQEIVDYLQEYLIKNKSEWMEQHFGLVYQTSFQSNSLLELQNFCTDCMTKSPQIIFDSLDFTSLNEKSLISLIKRDDLQMKEIDIWENVLKWGLEKNPTLLSDSTTWSNDDFKMMENTLQHCLPLVRFFSLSSEDFFQKVRPYKKLLKHSLYEELLESYLNPNSIPSDNILLPRDSFKDPILSHVIDTEYALFYDNNFGPTFGKVDIDMRVLESDDSEEYDLCRCEQASYEKKIRETEDEFSVEDYEVFQIIKNDD